MSAGTRQLIAEKLGEVQAEIEREEAVIQREEAIIEKSREAIRLLNAKAEMSQEILDAIPVSENGEVEADEEYTPPLGPEEVGGEPLPEIELDDREAQKPWPSDAVVTFVRTRPGLEKSAIVDALVDAVSSNAANIRHNLQTTIYNLCKAGKIRMDTRTGTYFPPDEEPDP